MRLSFTRPHLHRGGLFCILILFGVCLHLPAQFKFREPPNRQQPDALSTEAGERVWEWFLWNREIGRFTLEGSLTYRPSGADSVEFDFQLQGDWQGACHETAVTLSGDGTQSATKAVDVCGGQAFLVDSGENESSRVLLDAAAMSRPVFEALPFTWNDLLMPYLGWGPPDYLGPVRFLGRPAHKFALLNPDRDAFPERVVVTIDEDYAALLEAELFDGDGFAGKRMRVDGFKKFGEDWMFSGLTWENRAERSSVRLKVYSFKSTNL
jgi:hypothetical protein